MKGAEKKISQPAREKPVQMMNMGGNPNMIKIEHAGGVPTQEGKNMIVPKSTSNFNKQEFDALCSEIVG